MVECLSVCNALNSIPNARKKKKKKICSRKYGFQFLESESSMSVFLHIKLNVLVIGTEKLLSGGCFVITGFVSKGMPDFQMFLGVR